MGMAMLSGGSRMLKFAAVDGWHCMQWVTWQCLFKVVSDLNYRLVTSSNFMLVTVRGNFPRQRQIQPLVGLCSSREGSSTCRFEISEPPSESCDR